MCPNSHYLSPNFWPIRYRNVKWKKINGCDLIERCSLRLFSGGDKLLSCSASMTDPPPDAETARYLSSPFRSFSCFASRATATARASTRRMRINMRTPKTPDMMYIWVWSLGGVESLPPNL